MLFTGSTTCNISIEHVSVKGARTHTHTHTRFVSSISSANFYQLNLFAKPGRVVSYGFLISYQ
jgi:hypothetical protein